MRKTMLTLLLAVASASAAAEWVEVYSDPVTTYYIDPTTIRRDGDLAQMRELLDHNAARVRDKASYVSSRTQSEYDCKAEKVRTLSLSLHSGNMAAGKTLHRTNDPGKWRPVPPGGATEVLWKIACGKGHCD